VDKAICTLGVIMAQLWVRQ